MRPRDYWNTINDWGDSEPTVTVVLTNGIAINGVARGHGAYGGADLSPSTAYISQPGVEHVVDIRSIVCMKRG